MSKIIDLTSIIKQRKSNGQLVESLAKNGWSVRTGGEFNNGSVIIYLKDMFSESVLAFGLDKNSFMAEVSRGEVHWGHFVLAWDVVIDTELPHDDIHINETMKIFIKSLGRLKIRTEILNYCEGAGSFGIIVVVDRNNMEEPFSYEIKEIDEMINELRA